MESEVENVEVKNLLCGTEYQMFIQAISPVGFSKASQTLVVKTKGSST